VGGVGRSRLTFDDGWRARCASSLWWWPTLTAEERTRLEGSAERFLHRCSWQAARGFEVTEEMTVLVAVQGCLVALGLDGDPLRTVRTIVLRSSGVTLTAERPIGVAGVVTNTPLPIVGHAGGDTLTLAWDAVMRDLRWPGRGENVVIHEFAHALDFGEGRRKFPDDATRRRWVDACDDAYARLRHDASRSVLRSYGATNPAEFFAVATETFFDAPLPLREHEPALYDVFCAYFRQDPARRATQLIG